MFDSRSLGHFLADTNRHYVSIGRHFTEKYLKKYLTKHLIVFIIADMKLVNSKIVKGQYAIMAETAKRLRQIKHLKDLNNVSEAIAYCVNTVFYEEFEKKKPGTGF